jgi:hypothetical protein
MKWAREFIFDEFALEEEEKDDDDFEMAMTVILKDEIRQPSLGSLFSYLYVNRDNLIEHHNTSWQWQT